MGSSFTVGLIIVSALNTPIIGGQQEKLAAEAAIDATYKQSGLEGKVQHTVDRLDKKYVPPAIKDISGWAILSVKLVTEQRLVWSWTF